MRAWFFALICALGFSPPCVAPAQSLDAIVKRGTLRVGLTGDYRPFAFRDARGAYEGMDVDLAENLATALGVRLEIVATNWPELARDFETQKFDMAMGGVTITLDRARKGFFSTPLMREGKTPIARCADKDKFARLEDIDKPDVRVIVNPGGTNERFARRHLKSAPIRVFPDNVAIFDQIAKGEADVMMTDVSETLYQQKRHPGALCAIHPEAPFDFAEKGVWMQPDIALKLFVDQWLHVQIESGAFAALKAKWLN